MPGTPVDWNVVVLGAWNLAILTPEGIARRVFDLPQGTPVEVRVAVNQPAPVQVIHDNIIAMPSSGRLVLQPNHPGADALRAAAMNARRAISQLPETPFGAVGVNVRYAFDPIPDPLQDLLASPIDGRLADHQYQYVARQFKRSVAWHGGALNLEVQEVDAAGRVELNFHRQSSVVQELDAWLGRIDEMLQVTLSVVRDVLNVVVAEEGQT